MKKTLFLIILFFLTVVIYGKEFSFQRNNLLYTVIYEDELLIGEPITYRLIIKNITDKAISIKDINKNRSIIFLYADNNYKISSWFSILAMDSSPIIILKPGEFRDCDYQIYPDWGIKEYYKYGFPTGEFGFIYETEKIPLDYFVINNDNNKYIEYLYDILHGLNEYRNIEPYYNKYLEIEKSKNENLICASKYYFLQLLRLHEGINKNQLTGKSIYELNPDFVNFETECRNFLKKYPNKIYYSQEVKKILFRDIANKSKENYEKLLKEEYDYFFLNNADFSNIINEMNKKYKL